MTSMICIRERSGSPSNQMDILTSVVAIAQFVMLLCEFSVQLAFNKSQFIALYRLSIVRVIKINVGPEKISLSL